MVRDEEPILSSSGETGVTEDTVIHTISLFLDASPFVKIFDIAADRLVVTRWYKLENPICLRQL